MTSPRLGPIAGRVLPCGLAFFASGCIMVVELVAGRVIARHVGQSLYTWTSVIGVVLGGISLGNLIGGRLADWFETRRTLGVLFLCAAVACLAVPPLNQWVGEASWLVRSPSWPLRIATHVTLVFLLPSTVLGLIGPVVAKMALDQGMATGRTVGNVYAWGALGSIVGTFATGFWLIALMKTSGIIFTIAGLLALVGLALMPFFTWPLVGSFIVAAFLFLGGRDYCLENLRLTWNGLLPVVRERLAEGEAYRDLYLEESQYSFIKVTEDVGGGTRDLILDNLIHAHYVPGDPRDLRYGYEQIYAALTDRFAGDRDTLSTLFLGGGGYIFPRYVRDRWPGSTTEVVEIDPGVTRASLEAMGLAEEDVRIHSDAAPADTDPLATCEPPMEIVHLDARNHVDDLLQRKQRGDPDFRPFDFVYGDAFNDFSVPFHLVTREFCSKIQDLLTPDTGVYMVNIIDIYASGRFLGAFHNAMRQVFPHTYVLVTSEGGPSEDTDQRDTFVVVGALRELDLADLGERPGETSPEAVSLLTPEHLDYLHAQCDNRVLTDDWSPVENLLELVVRGRAYVENQD